jgi:hypothetical protein
MLNQTVIMEAVTDYCTKHKLPLWTKEQLVERDGEDEWEGTAFAAMADADCFAPPVLVVLEDGTIQVVEMFADGRHLLEDQWGTVSLNKVRRGERLHAE